MGIHDAGYVARIWLYFFFGVLDAMWQTTAYWIMGAMSNDPAKLAYFSGLCMCLFFSCRVVPDALRDRQVTSVRWCGWHLESRRPKDTVSGIHLCWILLDVIATDI